MISHWVGRGEYYSVEYSVFAHGNLYRQYVFRQYLHKDYGAIRGPSQSAITNQFPPRTYDTSEREQTLAIAPVKRTFHQAWNFLIKPGGLRGYEAVWSGLGCSGGERG